MNFIEAVKLLLEGKKIRLSRWREGKYYKKYPYGDDTVLDESRVQCVITFSDMLADDWEIYREEPKLHTFEQALTALKNGKKIRRQSSISEYHLDKASSRIIEIYDVEVHNGEAWWGESFSDEEVLANDWIIQSL